MKRFHFTKHHLSFLSFHVLPHGLYPQQTLNTFCKRCSFASVSICRQEQSTSDSKSSYTKILGRGSFSDYKKVRLTSGAGGDGSITFNKSKSSDYGPPSGGSGGDGGSIYVVASREISTLNNVMNAYSTYPGAKGAGKFQSGKSGDDVEIRVPLGTVIRSLHISQHVPTRPSNLPDGSRLEVDSDEYRSYLDILHQHYLFREDYIPGPDRVLMLLERIYNKAPHRQTQTVELDLVNEGQRHLLLKGGRGGHGNPHFVTPLIQGPGIAERGQPGSSMLIELELKTIADAGLVGLPNAGKSTLLKAVSNAHPRIAPYPFTTLNPYVGTIDYADFWSMTIADIPGIIEGANENRGLGHRFLRHIERTKILVYVIDLASPEPWKDLKILQSELEAYKTGLTHRPSLIAANKADVSVVAKSNYQRLARETKIPIVPVSAKQQGNITKLTSVMRNMIESLA